MSRPSFRAAPAKVRVSASSANLGPGFDSLGLALELYDVLAAQVADEKCLEVDVAGEGAEELRRDAKNLVVKAMNAAFDHMGGRPRGLRLSCANSIPHSRGLGSSSAAIIGGMALARALVLGGHERLPDEKIINVQPSMRTKAVEPVQGEFQQERLAQQQPAQRGLAHLQGVLELHVVADGGDHGLDLFVRKAQPLHDFFRQVRADFFVFVKMDAAGFFIARRRQRLGNVMHQHRPRQQRVGVRRHLLEHQP